MDTRNRQGTSIDSFDCHFLGCSASYRRKEHLARHLAQHAQTQSFECSICHRTFGRNDTLRRHMRRAHAVDELPSQTRRACSQCRRLKSRCEGGPPCRECIHRKVLCSLDGTGGPESTNRREPPRLLSDRPEPSLATSPRPERIRKDQHLIGLYFESFHPHWSFIHRGSFNLSRETPLLAQSMLVIGLWVSGGQNAQRAALDLHKTLDSAIRQQRQVWDASIAAEAGTSCSWPIPTYQAILLHIIFGIMHKGSFSVGFDLKISLPPADKQLLGSLVESCKRLGMFHYPNMLARQLSETIETFVWVSIEEVKRFDLALYKVYNLVSRIDARNSYNVAETSRGALSASDLQFPMPTNDRLWNSKGREEWMSAIPRDGILCTLDDAKEDEWISNSAELVGFFV